MDISIIYNLVATAFYNVLLISGPPILLATCFGLMVSLLQALTQIQEQTLSFIVKLVAVVISFLFGYSFFTNKLIAYTEDIFNSFYLIVR